MIKVVTRDMREKIGKIDRTVLELISGLVPFGLLCEAIGVFLVEQKLYYSIGLGLGLLIAAGMAVHMWRSLDRSLSAGEAVATKYITKSNLLRYGVVVLVLGVVMVTDFANPLAVFLGIMGLKVSAYLQPLTHKCFKKLFSWEDVFADPMPEEGMDNANIQP